MPKSYQFDPDLLAYDNEIEDFMSHEWPRIKRAERNDRLVSNVLLALLFCAAVYVTVAILQGW